MFTNVCSTNRCLQEGVTVTTVRGAKRGSRMTEAALSGKRRQILEFIALQIRDRGYPPSVREIGEAVGLTSSSTVHTHLQVLQREGYLQRDPTKPRAISVSFEPGSGAAMSTRPV